MTSSFYPKPNPEKPEHDKESCGREFRRRLENEDNEFGGKFDTDFTIHPSLKVEQKLLRLIKVGSRG